MALIKTIKELKEAIKDLPDEMLVEGYNGGDTPTNVTVWTIDKDEITDEDINDGIFVISTD
jgi:hypothetical protein